MARAKRKSTSLTVRILMIVLIVYLLYVLVGLRTKISDKKREIADYDTQIANRTAENAQLKSILNAEFDEEYIEQIAREVGYVHSDEKVYQSITD